jgi:hypothetical protein
LAESAWSIGEHFGFWILDFGFWMGGILDFGWAVALFLQAGDINVPVSIEVTSLNGHPTGCRSPEMPHHYPRAAPADQSKM